MNHLSSEDLLAYLDADESSANLKKVSEHLDMCSGCTVKLKDYALINIYLELTIDQARERREKELLRECLGTEQMYGLIENYLSTKERNTADQHLEKCEDCRKELEILSSLEDTSDVKLPEVRDPEKLLPKILRHVELYFVALERERAIAQEKKFIIPGLETIRKILFPEQPLLAPLGFAEIPRRNKEFYRQLDDAQLMEACKNLDTMAWRELEGRYREFACNIIKRYGLYEYRNVEWKDIWQDSLNDLSMYIKNYEERGNAKSYIGKIVFNECRNAWRRIKTYENIIKPLDDQTPEPIVDSEPSKILSDNEEANLLKDNIKSLPKSFSSTMLLSTDGFSDEEISKRMKTNINTVRTRKARARIKLFEMKSNEEEFMTKIRGRKLLKKILPSI